MKKLIIALAVILGLSLQAFPETFIGIGNLKYFERAYPDITFERRYDRQEGDWIISVTVPSVPGDKNSPGKTYEFYWANASFLPAEELANQDKYWPFVQLCKGAGRSRKLFRRRKRRNYEIQFGGKPEKWSGNPNVLI